MIRVAPIGILSWFALPYPAPKRLRRLIRSGSLRTRHIPRSSQAFLKGSSRVQLWIRKEPLASFRIEGISKRVPSPVLLIRSWAACLTSFVVCGATFVHPAVYRALCASDLRRLTRLVMGRRTVWRRDLIRSNKAWAFRFLFWTNRSQGFCLEK